MVRGRLKECKNTTHQWRKRFEKKLILFIEKKYVNFSYSPFYDDIEVDWDSSSIYIMCILMMIRMLIVKLIITIITIYNDFINGILMD